MLQRKVLWAGGAAVAVLACAVQPDAALAAARRSAKPSAAEAGALLDELKALKAEVETLKARLDAQTVTVQRTQDTAQAAQTQAATAQAQAQAADRTTRVVEARVEQIPAEVKTEVAAAKPKTDKLYYKGVSITLGGFLEAASIYRDHNVAADIATGFNAIPYDNVRTGHSDELRFSARQSRISALVEGDATPDVHLAAYGEFDFQGAAQTANSNESNSYNPRIRHLYATADYTPADAGYGLHLLAGQNWSLATLNSKGITPRNELTPPQIDAQYIPGFVWTRQPQVRLTGDFLNHSLWLAVSAENPQTTFYTTGTPAGASGAAGTAAALPGNTVYNITGGSGFNSANTLSLNHVPDVIAKAAYETKLGDHGIHAEAFGMFRAFYDRRNGADDNVYGGGAGFGLVAQIVPGLLDAQVSGLFGKGLGRYGSTQLPDATFRADGRIEPLTAAMMLAGGTLHATKLLDIYAFAGEEHVGRQAYTTPAGLAYGYGNPLYTNVGCSIEGSSACVGNTKLIDQVTGGFWQKIYQGPFGRMQFGMQYSFTEKRGYSGVGGQPNQNENIVFTSLRYYPF